MALPINIDELITGTVVEWERLEFKEGWNDLMVMHTLCAFANDFNNWGGGYIIIGIAEKENRPVLPPKGLTQAEASKIQDEILNIGRKIYPDYIPVVEPIVFSGKLILVIWAPGGQNRPYSAPKSFIKGSEQINYIRRLNHTVQANKEERVELFEMAANVPFDDRINHQHDLNDIKIPLITDFLKQTKSDLSSFSDKMSIAQLGAQMAIIDGPMEYLKPKNIGLMLFNDHPERIFIKSQIEVVIFHDGVGGDDMTEKIFEGPIHYQIRDTLNFIKNNIIEEHVRKLHGRAEAERVFNYPYNALEEALVNAMFHRSYEIREPVKVRIYPDKISIVSYPGPDRSIRDDDLKRGEIVGRRYRNRKIGDFFKELKITEGKSTGIPKIFRAMQNNGSPVPVFSTDEDRTYFIVTLSRHRYFKTKKNVLPPEPENRIFAILKFCLDEPRSRKEILNHIGLTNLYANYKRLILPLIDMNMLQLTITDKPTSSKQEYITTGKGEKFMTE